MAAQDEDRISLGKLPLADLKTWLEDNLSLQGGAGIIGGTGGSGDTIINQVGSHVTGWPRWTSGPNICPVPGWTSPFATLGPIIISGTAWSNVWCGKFEAPASITVDTWHSVMKGIDASNASTKVEYAVYNANADTRLATTGLKHANSDLGLTTAGVETMLDIPLTTTLDLVAGTVYTIALFRLGGGSTLSADIAGAYSVKSKAAIRYNGGNVAVDSDIIKYSVACEFAATGMGSLPATNLNTSADAGTPATGGSGSPLGYLT